MAKYTTSESQGFKKTQSAKVTYPRPTIRVCSENSSGKLGNEGCCACQ